MPNKNPNFTNFRGYQKPRCEIKGCSVEVEQNNLCQYHYIEMNKEGRWKTNNKIEKMRVNSFAKVK